MRSHKLQLRACMWKLKILPATTKNRDAKQINIGKKRSYIKDPWHLLPTSLKKSSVHAVRVCVPVHSLQSCLTLRPPGLYPTTLLCPLDSPGKNTGVGCHFPLQGIFPTQGSNLQSPVSPAWAAGFFTTEPPGKLLMQ